MIIYFDSKWHVVDEKDATFAKVIPDDGEPPYFVAVNKDEKDKNGNEVDTDKRKITRQA